MGLEHKLEQKEELSHQQLLDSVLSAIEELKKDVGGLSKKLGYVETKIEAINTRLTRIDTRLAEGDRRMNEQDTTLVFQSKALRNLSEIRAARKKVAEDLETLAALEAEAIKRLKRHRRDPDHDRPTDPVPPPERITEPDNEKPEP